MVLSDVVDWSGQRVALPMFEGGFAGARGPCHRCSGELLAVPASENASERPVHHNWCPHNGGQ